MFVIPLCVFNVGGALRAATVHPGRPAGPIAALRQNSGESGNGPSHPEYDRVHLTVIAENEKKQVAEKKMNQL